jgi:hypothetical protein
MGATTDKMKKMLFIEVDQQKDGLPLFSVKTADTVGDCPENVDSTEGASRTLDLFYSNNISAVFGPICGAGKYHFDGKYISIIQRSR